jgi:hypothetical protein
MFRLRVREASGLVAIVALGAALLVERSSSQRLIAKLQREAEIERSCRVFRYFVATSLGELGALVMTEPHSARLYPLSSGRELLDLDRLTPGDILSQISTRESILVEAALGPALYKELAPPTVDDQASYYDPRPYARAEFARNGEKVLVFFGTENGMKYGKILVIDFQCNRRNSNYKWFKWRSSLIEKALGSDLGPSETDSQCQQHRRVFQVPDHSRGASRGGQILTAYSAQAGQTSSRAGQTAGAGSQTRVPGAP